MARLAFTLLKAKAKFKEAKAKRRKARAAPQKKKEKAAITTTAVKRYGWKMVHHAQAAPASKAAKVEPQVTAERFRAALAQFRAEAYVRAKTVDPNTPRGGRWLIREELFDRGDSIVRSAGGSSEHDDRGHPAVTRSKLWLGNGAPRFLR